MRKNIVVIVSGMNIGGAQTVVSALCNYWSQNGYFVTLICTFTKEKIEHYKINKNVAVKYLSNNPVSPGSNIINLPWKLMQLRILIKQRSPNVIISFLTRVNIASIISTFMLKCPLIICERTWPPFLTLNKRFFWFYRILFRGVNKIIVQTHKSKLWLNNKLPSCDVEVIPNPVIYPLPTRNMKSVPPKSVILKDKKIILASGRMHRVKQFNILIRAFSKVKDKFPNWNLVILGDGEERESLSQMSFNLGIGDRVFLPGGVGNMSDWYSRADLFVLSSLFEGFPNVLLEAMSHGLPCISFDINTGPGDIIQHGVNGILINPEEKELGLANAMTRIISNKALRLSLASKSALLKKQYSMKNIMKKWDNTLNLETTND